MKFDYEWKQELIDSVKEHSILINMLRNTRKKDQRYNDRNQLGQGAIIIEENSRVPNNLEDVEIVRD